MTNREKYRQAFDVLQTSGDLLREVNEMKKNRSVRVSRKLISACAAFAVVLGSFGAAYAMNVGGIKRTIQLWVRGDQTDAEIYISDDGTYTLQQKDENGQVLQQSGGGVVMDASGNERPATQEEILEQLDHPEVVYEEDGRVMVYYRDQKIDITDKFEDGVCYVKLRKGEKTLYMTIKYQDGDAISESGYIQPGEFNTH